MTRTHRAQPAASHFVHGAPLEDAAGTPIAVIYPATGEDIARIHAATPGVIEHALDSAAEGLAVWSATPPAERGRVLRRAADLIRTRNAELSELETLDTGKPISETLVADWASGADALEWFGTLAAGLSGEAIDLGGDFVLTRLEPLGICLGIGAWNYPSQIACWKAGPALACGNALIFKPSEVTPLGALKLAEIFLGRGFRQGSSMWSRAPARSAPRCRHIRPSPRSRSPARSRPARRSMPLRPPVSSR